MKYILAFCLSLWAAAVMAAPASGQLVHYDQMSSKYVAARNVTVWLPDGYDPKGKMLPVIYMHDGQNIFEPGAAYGGQEWGVDETLTTMKTKAIVVGIWNTPARYEEYFPQKLYDYLPDSFQNRITDRAKGPLIADNYLKFIVHELKPFIDKTYRTQKSPQGTFIMGSSMGGLISLYALSEYPEVFGGAACLSIHWPLSTPADTPEAEAILADQVAAAYQAYFKSTRLKPMDHKLYTDHGTINLDRHYRPYSQRMDAVFSSLGWTPTTYKSLVFDGTDHNEAAWRARFDQPMRFLLTKP